ncbi:hypothetical protein [Modestobacter versicolor]|uniref:hypothetical protein n=1 Tax=Modestobacter versicolor TaxID=429133 RepID=UPI0034DFCE9D
MGWEQLTDFEREMYLAVAEGASLAEVPRGVDDGVFGGGVLGPWDPEACSAHLVRWFDQGLIQLYEFGDNSPDRVLSPTIGRERLVSWGRWAEDDERWWHTYLAVTEGAAAEFAEAAGLTSTEPGE